MTSSIFVRLTPLTEAEASKVSCIRVCTLQGGVQGIGATQLRHGGSTGKPALCNYPKFQKLMSYECGILAEGAIALPVTLSGGALFAS